MVASSCHPRPQLFALGFAMNRDLPETESVTPGGAKSDDDATPVESPVIEEDTSSTPAAITEG